MIVYPEKAFDGDYKQQGYNYWMTTVEECKKYWSSSTKEISYYTISKINHHQPTEPLQNKIMVRRERNRLYYPLTTFPTTNMRRRVPENSLSTKTEKSQTLRLHRRKSSDLREHDVMPLVDKFVEEHPTSPTKSKGVIALTGYEEYIQNQQSR